MKALLKSVQEVFFSREALKFTLLGEVFIWVAAFTGRKECLLGKYRISSENMTRLTK